MLGTWRKPRVWTMRMHCRVKCSGRSDNHENRNDGRIPIDIHKAHPGKAPDRPHATPSLPFTAGVALSLSLALSEASVISAGLDHQGSSHSRPFMSLFLPLIMCGMSVVLKLITNTFVCSQIFWSRP